MKYGFSAGVLISCQFWMENIAKLSAHVLFSNQVRWVNVFPTGHQGASEKDQNGAGLHQPVIANWRKRDNALRGSISAGLRSAGLIHLEVPLVPIALLARHFTPAGCLVKEWTARTCRCSIWPFTTLSKPWCFNCDFVTLAKTSATYIDVITTTQPAPPGL